MKKQIFTIALTLAMFLGMPHLCSARSAVEIIEQDFQNISVIVVGATMHVTGANGQVLQIYNVAGVCVKNIKVEGNDKMYELNLPKGCYIVKVGKAVRKISVNR